jgi:outer membrane protein OmpA-like peptidoglycan-associated protein
MKNKFLILSLLLAGTCGSVNAQETENYYTKKWSDNIFVGAGVGAMSVINDGFNTPTFNFNVQLGKYITPTWGVRGEVSGLWQSLDDQDNGFHAYCRKFAEINLDAMLNLTNLIGGTNPDRKVDFYAFGGPTANFAKATNTTLTISQDGSQSATYDTKGLKTRFGATVGLGLGYNISSKWAVGIEARVGVTPSIFGDASDCRKAESTGRLTIGAAYTFGGKKFVKPGLGSEVVREVVKEVPVEVVKEVTKEVVKEVPGNASAAIFFKIGKAAISDEGMVNVKLMAKVIKNNPNAKYEVAGYADKGTGSVAGNQTLSEKRAQAVFDALVAEGVNPDQLVKVGNGGTDPMFEKANLNRVVILEVK